MFLNAFFHILISLILFYNVNDKKLEKWGDIDKTQ